jgi:Ca2+-binding EF-hand superfamily protein
MVNRSRIKFKELDVNKAEMLLNKEICILSEYCLSLDKVNIYDKEKIMHNIEQRHTTADAGLSFEEFLVLYEEERRVQANLVFATRKFKELDEDRSGYLGGAELNEVVEWILDNGQVK